MVNFENEIITITAMTIFMFIMLRWLFWNIVDFQLNKSERKKRKINQSFKEWFLYTRYRKEIPKFLLHLYFIIIVIHFSVFLSVLILFLFDLSVPILILDKVITCFAWVDILITTILYLAFYGRKRNITYVNVGRWIKKGKKK